MRVLRVSSINFPRSNLVGRDHAAWMSTSHEILTDIFHAQQLACNVGNGDPWPSRAGGASAIPTAQLCSANFASIQALLGLTRARSRTRHFTFASLLPAPSPADAIRTMHTMSLVAIHACAIAHAHINFCEVCLHPNHVVPDACAIAHTHCASMHPSRAFRQHYRRARARTTCKFNQ